MIINEIQDKNGITFFSYKKNFLDKKQYENIKNILKNTNNWKDGVSYNGDIIKRKQKWFHMNNKYFCDKWLNKYDRWRSFDYNKDYINIQDIIQKHCNIFLKDKNIKSPSLNSILINYYEKGYNRIGFHKDNKLSFGDKPTIIILSIGSSRTLRFERTIPHLMTRDKDSKYLNFDLVLEDNSLFIMGGNSQMNWVHSILKNESDNERYSLTFREHIL